MIIYSSYNTSANLNQPAYPAIQDIAQQLHHPEYAPFLTHPSQLNSKQLTKSCHSVEIRAHSYNTHVRHTHTQTHIIYVLQIRPIYINTYA